MWIHVRSVTGITSLSYYFDARAQKETNLLVDTGGHTFLFLEHDQQANVITVSIVSVTWRTVVCRLYARTGIFRHKHAFVFHCLLIRFNAICICSVMQSLCIYVWKFVFMLVLVFVVVVVYSYPCAESKDLWLEGQIYWLNLLRCFFPWDAAVIRTYNNVSTYRRNVFRKFYVVLNLCYRIRVLVLLVFRWWYFVE